MTNLIRWEPECEMMTLREAMDRLFDDAFTRPLGIRDGWRGSGVPAVDMYQTDNDVVVKATLPGMKADDSGSYWWLRNLDLPFCPRLARLSCSSSDLGPKL